MYFLPLAMESVITPQGTAHLSVYLFVRDTRKPGYFTLPALTRALTVTESYTEFPEQRRTQHTRVSTRCNEMLCSPQVCVGNERAYEFLPWGRDGQAITQDGCQAVVAVDGQGLCSKRLATVNLIEIRRQVDVFLGGVDNPPHSNYKEDVAQK